jgi:hypothetical protein
VCGEYAPVLDAAVGGPPSQASHDDVATRYCRYTVVFCSTLVAPRFLSTTHMTLVVFRTSTADLRLHILIRPPQPSPCPFASPRSQGHETLHSRHRLCCWNSVRPTQTGFPACPLPDDAGEGRPLRLSGSSPRVFSNDVQPRSCTFGASPRAPLSRPSRLASTSPLFHPPPASPSTSVIYY